MQKIITLLFIGILACAIPISAGAINTSTSGRTLEKFKEKHEKVLFETLPFTEVNVNEVLESEYRMNGLEALRGRLKHAENYYQGKKNITTSARNSLEDTLQVIDNSISRTNETIKLIQKSIQIKQQKIQSLFEESQVLKKKIVDRRKVILEYIANIYAEGNFIINEENELDIMQSLILTNADTDFYLTDITYKALVVQLGQQFVDEYRNLVREQYLNSVQTSDEKRLLQDLQGNLEQQVLAFESQKKERQSLLEITKGQEALFVKYIVEQQKQQKVVEEAWKVANNNRKDSMDRFLKQYNCKEKPSTEKVTKECDNIYKFFENEAELSKTAYATGTTNIFSWPIDSRRITTYFRDAGYYKFLHSQHDAIDIGAPQGTPIYAPADGYVYYILAPAPGNYSYIALKHKDGFVSVYGHLSEVVVTPYQFVRQGELIAKSGGAPGTPGAGPMTTGAHLHLELWQHKTAIDPLRYMTVADIDYKSLPSRYQQKFIEDIVEKLGNEADTSKYKIRFALKGETEKDRQKYLLKTYATKDFQNWNMWVDTAIAERIDPSFMMCIGLSETTLGNNLKTAYNIGNVGNTDSGSTMIFKSPKEGIVRMAKTFNNKYLGTYTKVSELSRWGNNKGVIYASSNSNWHENTIRCLSALKGRFVEDDFQFRIKRAEILGGESNKNTKKVKASTKQKK